jgi:type III secretion protein U
MSRKSTQSKTERPTRKRLRELRRQGRVARSADVPATAVVLAGIMYLVFAGVGLVQGLSGMLDRAAKADFAALDSTAAIADWTHGLLMDAWQLLWPLLVVLAVAAALAGFIQVGGIFSVEAVKPQLSRVSPGEGLRRLFSLHTVIELAKLLLKTALLALVVWFLTRQMLTTLLQSHWIEIAALLPLSTSLISILAWSALGCFVAVTVFDVWFQRWQFERQNRMTIEEVRREHREMEGDPQIRVRRRQIHREVTEASMLQDLRKANVVIVNPTHIAVALYYSAGETDLPVVIAKGEGDLAREIRRIAEAEGIPVMQNVDLARRLQSTATVNQYIPEELIEPVAIVLRWAQSLAREP